MEVLNGLQFYRWLRGVAVYATLAATLYFLLPVEPAQAVVLSVPTNNLGLTAYWKFDDATSTKATDFSGNGNTGTLTSSPTWTTGRYGSGVTFNGTNYVDANAALFTSIGSLSIWFKPSFNSGAAVTESLWTANNASNDMFRSLHFSDGSWLVNWRMFDDAGPQITIADSLTPFKANTWHQFTFTWNDTTNFSYVYFDGVQVASNTNLTTRTLTTFRIGEGWTGSLDDLRMYNRDLSAAEVYTLYAAGRAVVNARNGSGLVGYWSLDDGTSTKATDFSGNGNTATLSGGSWVTGKFGKALSFNGSSDYVDLGGSSALTPSTALTLSVWFKISGDGSGSSPNMLISNQVGAAGWRLGYETSDDKIYFDVWDSGGNNAEARTTAAVTNNKWYHAVAVYNGTATVALYLNGVPQTLVGGSNNGSIGSTGGVHPVFGAYANNTATFNFNGQLDDVRIYNRALSSTEVIVLYNDGAASARPVITTVSRNGLLGYWSFEDATGTQATDFSGNGYTGTLTNGPLWSTSGKFGNGLFFDGTVTANDYVNTNATVLPAGTTGNITVSGWVNPLSISGGQTIAGYTDATNGFYFGFSGGTVQVVFPGIGTFGDSSGVAVAPNQWQMLTMTISSGGVINFYRNGVLLSTPGTQNYNATTDNLWIGATSSGGSPTNVVKGVLDDVRVYNRVLSADEIRTLYNTAR